MIGRYLRGYAAFRGESSPGGLGVLDRGLVCSFLMDPVMQYRPDASCICCAPMPFVSIKPRVLARLLRS